VQQVLTLDVLLLGLGFVVIFRRRCTTPSAVRDARSAVVWERGEATHGERRLHAVDVAKLVRMVAELLQVGRQHLVLVGHVHAYVLVGRRDVRQIVVLLGRATKSLCKPAG
jgi:hypothetical protein